MSKSETRSKPKKVRISLRQKFFASIVRQFDASLLAQPTMFTSASQASCLNPIRVSSQRELLGPQAFISLTSGQPVTHNLHELYRQGKISAPNVVIFGGYGRGKSSLLKTVYGLHPLAVDSYNAHICVFDRKRQKDSSGAQDGEYLRLADQVGGTRVVFDRRPGAGSIINLLDPALAAAGNENTTVGQDELLTMAATVARGSNLTDYESFVLRVAHHEALSVAAKQDRVPILEDVVQALLNPSMTQAGNLLGADALAALNAEGRLTKGDLMDWGLPVAFALQKFTRGGELSGLVDGETSTNVAWDAPLTVFDTSALQEGSKALGFAMMVAAAYIQARWMVLPGDKTLIVEEGYHLDSLPGIPAILKAIALRGRSQGCGMVTAFHHLTQIGPESELMALIRDAAIQHFYYQMSDQDIDLLIKFFGLPKKTADVMRQLTPGLSLLKVGDQPLEMVQHIRSPLETWLTDTNDGMAEITNFRKQA